MPDDYISLLKKHIEDNKLNENDYIFFSRKKKTDPIPEQTFRRYSNAYCKAISPNFHFHQFRKSAVTHLFDKDVSLEEIKDFVGHSSSKITKDVYLQKSNERQEKILDILNETMQELK